MILLAPLIFQVSAVGVKITRVFDVVARIDWGSRLRPKLVVHIDECKMHVLHSAVVIRLRLWRTISTSAPIEKPPRVDHTAHELQSITDPDGMVEVLFSLEFSLGRSQELTAST